MSNTLIDNSCGFELIEYLKKYVSDNRCNHIRIASGYWDLPGTKLIYDELQAFLHHGGRLDLLIGQEPMLRSYQMRNDLSKEERFPDFYIKRDVDKLSDEYKPVVHLLLDYMNEDEDKSQVRIRVYGQDGEEKRFLHAKCYIFTGEGLGYGIVGSSNFTQKGLQDNAELNYLETSSLIVKNESIIDNQMPHLYWFNKHWEESIPWTGKFIKEILLPSPVGTAVQKEKNELTPYEVYIKYLQTQFGDIANPDAIEILKSYLPKGFTSLSYQLDAVQQCFYIMRQHGGFILGDVVGLGKTIIGVLVIKKFLNEASSLGRLPKVLVVVPPAVKSSWEKTVSYFDKERIDKIAPFITFITTGSIGKIIMESDTNDATDVEDTGTEDFESELAYDNYGMILIDESHNFRNRSAQKYKDLDDLIQTIDARTGAAPFIGLLSATPQNNTPTDIYNQILFFQREPNKSSLPNIPGGKLDSFMSEKSKLFAELRKKDTPEAKAELQLLAEEIRDKVLNELVVRRTRKDIKTFYQQDSETLRFPTVKGPHKLEYKLDKQLCQLFADTIDYIVGDPKNNQKSKIGYYRYTGITFFKDKKNKDLYKIKNLTPEKIAEQLANIMRILLVKRLESSFTAFKKSLHNLQRYTQNMIDMINADAVFICPDLDINDIIAKHTTLQNAIPFIEEKIKEKGGNNRRFNKADFKDEYLDNLKKDKALIDALCERWDENDYDPKLDVFKECINTKLFNPEINNPSGFDKPRLVVFSEAKDTVDSLERVLNAKGHKVLKVTAENRVKKQSEIQENFDANSKVQKDDYDVIVTTEVLAEGVNLHRANVILNYDTPWNATRLMQRIGRVNRIGSKEEFVHVFNFFPSYEGNEQIKLAEIAYAKLQAFHTMFGEDNKVFTEAEELSEAGFQHIVDGEVSPLSEYIQDMKDFQNEQPERFKYLQGKEFLHIGGTIGFKDEQQSLVVIHSENRGLTNIIIDKDRKASVVAPITAMQFLKCGKDEKFSKKPMDSEIEKQSMMEYSMHVNKMRTSKDATAEVKKAQKFLHETVKPKLISQEARKAYGYADKALRGNSHAVARQILKFAKVYETQGASMFGLDNDVNEWVTSAFGRLAEQGNKKNGEAKIALTITK